MTKAKWVGVGLLICGAFVLFCGAVGVVWYLGPDPKDALAAVSRHIGPDPKSTVVSSDPSKWESELAPAIKKLPDDEKRLVGAYLVRRRMAEAFGVKNFGKDG